MCVSVCVCLFVFACVRISISIVLCLCAWMIINENGVTHLKSPHFVSDINSIDWYYDEQHNKSRKACWADCLIQEERAQRNGDRDAPRQLVECRHILAFLSIHRHQVDNLTHSGLASGCA